ncbi:DUF222 domain-containing protein [Pseudactinotalea sp. HY160]|nr:DUF222 domain-containing protein [Pseudactinotalea sp. HY160]
MVMVPADGGERSVVIMTIVRPGSAPGDRPASGDSRVTESPDEDLSTGDTAVRRRDGQVADAAAVAALERLTDEVEALAGLDWAGAPGQSALDALTGVEQLTRRLEALQARVTAAAESDGLWALDGSRTLPVWLQTHTGASRGSALRTVRTARSLRDHLPGTFDALRAGQVGADHVAVLVRETTRTGRMREQLRSDEAGEDFLLSHARGLDATAFARIGQAWAIAADPQAADRAWREDGAKEQVTLAETTGGYHLTGWLDPGSGRLVQEALSAHLCRPSADDARTPAQRRAAALTSLAQESLTAGRQQSSARIRPHLTITVPWLTLEAMVAAAGSVGNVGTVGSADPGAPQSDTTHPPEETEATGAMGDAEDTEDTWARARASEDDAVISTRLDTGRMRGLEPATFPDGTPLAPAQLARFACDSSLARVVFGPESTVLDVGREQRIFPANQARAVIARDRHCQYPGCYEPPGFGEIHHSLWWGRHDGPTAVSHGILLCWTHHELVHRREITIARRDGHWRFTRIDGSTITAPEHGTRTRRPR